MFRKLSTDIKKYSRSFSVEKAGSKTTTTEPNKTPKIPIVGKNVENWKPCALWVGMQSRANVIKHSMVVSKKK